MTVGAINQMSIKALLEASGIGTSELALALGKSKATVSQVVNEKYHGRKEVVGEVRSYLEAKVAESTGSAIPVADACAAVAGGTAGAPSASTGGTAVAQPADSPIHPFTDSPAPALTSGQKQAWVLMELTRKQRDFAMLIGASGVGKTHVSKRFCSEVGADFYTAHRNMSLGGLLGGLCRLWGVPVEGTIDACVSRLCSAAKGRMLVVDEADLLVSNRNRHSVLRLIEVFRQLYENGAGVVLIGLPSLHLAVSRASETYVFSRIGYFRAVVPPTDENMASYWSSLVAGYAGAVEKAGPVVMEARRRGFFRFVEKLADLVKLFEGDVEQALGLMFRPADPA